MRLCVPSRLQVLPSKRWTAPSPLGPPSQAAPRWLRGSAVSSSWSCLPIIPFEPAAAAFLSTIGGEGGGGGGGQFNFSGRAQASSQLGWGYSGFLSEQKGEGQGGSVTFGILNAVDAVDFKLTTAQVEIGGGDVKPDLAVLPDVPVIVSIVWPRHGVCGRNGDRGGRGAAGGLGLQTLGQLSMTEGVCQCSLPGRVCTTRTFSASGYPVRPILPYFSCLSTNLLILGR